ncbi:MAG: PorV/PorQ family protein [Balneolaceae bacterium]
MRIFLLMLFAGIISIPAKAQFRITAVPFIIENEGIRSYSLGNSLIAFKGDVGAHHLNPASINHKGLFNFGLMKNEDNFGESDWTNTWKNLYLGYTFGSFDVATSYKNFNSDFPNYYGTQQREINESLLNVSTSYSFENGIRAGFGLNYISSRLPSNEGISAQKYNSSKSFSVDFGIQYETIISVKESWSFIPKVGASLTDFGSPIRYTEEQSGDPLPMRLRLGSGFTLETNQKLLGMKAFGINTSLGFSKLMARNKVEVNNSSGINDSTYVPMKPLEALFNSWDTYEWFDGSVNRSVLREQIWTHAGLELNFLETLAVRFGYQDGGKPNASYNFSSLGFGVNLGYLQFDYAKIHYLEHRINEYRWQLIGRIPLNGKRPDSILNLLF